MSNHIEPLILGADPHSAKVLCVFSHGRTQTPEGMVEDIIGHLDLGEVHVVLPRARDKSWYAARAIDPLTPESQTELTAALDYLQTLVKAARSTVGENVPVVMAGFSQGACLTMEYAFRFGGWPGAMACLTGCRVGVATDQRPVADLTNLPVYLTGADKDPWIPVTAFADAAAALGAAKARLRTDLFPDRPHSMNAAEILALQSILTRTAAGRAPFQETSP